MVDLVGNAAMHGTLPYERPQWQRLLSFLQEPAEAPLSYSLVDLLA